MFSKINEKEVDILNTQLYTFHSSRDVIYLVDFKTFSMSFFNHPSFNPGELLPIIFTIILTIFIYIMPKKMLLSNILSFDTKTAQYLS